MKIIILWLIFCLLLWNSLALLSCKSANAGSFITYTLTICALLLLLLIVFNKKAQTFFTSGYGAFIKYAFFAFAALLFILALFIHFAPRAKLPTGSEKALIVLGAAVVGERITDLLRRRLDAAVSYYKKHPDIIIITSGGQGPREARPEGVIMREYLISKGVPAENVIAEDKSVSTQQNFELSLQALKERGISAGDEAIFVTNTFHCFRAGLYAKKAGFANMHCLPASIGKASILPCYSREGLALIYAILFKL